ncbi:MAG: class I SAM-dependent methyltransferase [Oligoflexia bacterium]|nr:class I SAM-dependent methyltransferase [Oligoflexia bacterium]
MEKDKQLNLRFDFGKNWATFLKGIDEERINSAIDSLRNFLKVDDFSGLSFLDVGHGSGLFSLAARKLGARVHSFDYDNNSVQCANTLKEKYFPGDSLWTIEQGSALDANYLSSIGKYDIVYSWGVLHHTGSMYAALSNVILPMKANSKLFVSIYNTQLTTGFWKKIKKIYISSSQIERSLLIAIFFVFFFLSYLIKDLITPRNPCLRFKNKVRGMSFFTDVIDWIGGYPFETARPEEIFNFFKERNLQLVNLSTVGGKMGCNEFVFQRIEKN